jgi:hypothetical protein
MVACFSMLAPLLLADPQQERRTEIGLKLFRTMLAADLKLEQKAHDGQLLVLFFHKDDKKRAEQLAAAFARGPGTAAGEPIRGLPVAAEVASDSAFAAYAERRPAGIFLTQALDAATLRAIVRFGIAQGVIVYSPFEGHVESGVLGGLAVEAQVRPYINEATLSASNVSLKELFLKVSKVYR